MILNHYLYPMIFRKILLFPFSLLYGLVTAVRNFLYDSGVFSSYPVPGKSIVIGNLSMGGTGKSPHTLYLWEVLEKKYPVAILSRGYGRKTKGLLEVKEGHSSSEAGDEPLMFKKRTGEKSIVVVSESRKNGVEYIRSVNDHSVILLDDAFQHRKIKPGFSILLTDYNHPYYSDHVVPSGTLREWRCGKKRADCVIVTKCPGSLTEEEKKHVIERLKFRKGSIFFSQIIYGALVPFGKEKKRFSNILLVTGIADPNPLEIYLKRFYKVESMVFPDHHHFTEADLMKIHAKFDTFTPENSIIVTTEKDFVRLESLLTAPDKQKYPWHYQSITVKMDKQEQFNALINNYVDTI